MEQHVAAEHLEIIRTLMERSALYRRTLAPIMFCVGSVGCAGALGGSAGDRRALVLRLVAGAAVVAMAGAFVTAGGRRHDGEPFWSLALRGVAPPLLAAGRSSALRRRVRPPACAGRSSWPTRCYGALPPVLLARDESFGWLIIACRVLLFVRPGWSLAWTPA
jgi:hypothetical protein